VLLTIWSMLFFWLKTAYTSFPLIQSPQSFQRLHPTFVRQSGLMHFDFGNKFIPQGIVDRI
jgi:hypothetical protein